MFYKHCIDELIHPLSSLYTLCLNNSFLPADWSKSYITPIYKKGPRTDSNNYRPIALTCTMCKLMESVIKVQLVDFLTSNSLISNNQHAFLSQHSTLTNLLECTNDWFVSLNSRHSTDVIYIDFSRAFDSIVFDKLLFKLKHFGISGSLLSWIKNFLYNRKQCVVLDNCFSSVIDVLSGVPQGSVLGPILFILFIDDIDCVCTGVSTLKLFADDCRLYSEITLNTCNYTCLLQSLHNLCSWAKDNQLSINVIKCSILSIMPRSLNTQPSTLRSYSVNDFTLSFKSEVVDLGITISEDLSYKTHISNIVSKAYSRQSILFRGFVTRDLLFMRKAFVTYIRPIVEYDTPLWNPTEIYLIDLIESVQRDFSRRIPALSGLCYRDRLTKLNLDPLELRRLRYDLVQYYKILNNLTPLDPSKYFSIYNSIPSSRSSPTYLSKPIKASNKFLSSFFFRQVSVWNKLPQHIIQSNSLPSFKHSLKTFNLYPFLKSSSFI